MDSEAYRKPIKEVYSPYKNVFGSGMEAASPDGGSID